LERLVDSTSEQQFEDSAAMSDQLSSAERRDRWRRLAGTARWQDQTDVHSGAPAPSVAADAMDPA
jgi:hypothetical protein